MKAILKGLSTDAARALPYRCKKHGLVEPHIARRIKLGARQGQIARTCSACRKERRMDPVTYQRAQQYHRDNHRRKKRDLMRRIGGEKCACCGETTIEFLSIDHISGGGGRHRARLKADGYTNFYAWLSTQLDLSDYRVLCHNCNWAVGQSGVCPHQYGQRLILVANAD